MSKDLRGAGNGVDHINKVKLKIAMCRTQLVLGLAPNPLGTGAHTLLLQMAGHGGRAPRVVEQQTRNWPICADHHESADQTTCCTCRARKGERHDKIFPALGVGRAPPPLLISFRRHWWLPLTGLPLRTTQPFYPSVSRWWVLALHGVKKQWVLRSSEPCYYMTVDIPAYCMVAKLGL